MNKIIKTTIIATALLIAIMIIIFTTISIIDRKKIKEANYQSIENQIKDEEFNNQIENQIKSGSYEEYR